MALGSSNSNQKRDTIFVPLKFGTAKGAQGVGFRQTLSKTPIAGAVAGEKQFTYEQVMHNYVEGRLAGFVVREEPTYDDKTKNEFIGYASVADQDGGPNVVITFPLASGAGRRLVGLLNASQVQGHDPVLHIYTNFAEAGTVIGDKTLTKPAAYINARVGDSQGARLAPVYMDEAGQPLINQTTGAPEPLASGVKHTIAKKDIWDFTDADDMTMNTAIALTASFAKQSQSHAEGAPEDGANPEEGVDFNEAAAAAAPGQAA